MLLTLCRKGETPTESRERELFFFVRTIRVGCSKFLISSDSPILQTPCYLVSIFLSLLPSQYPHLYKHQANSLQHPNSSNSDPTPPHQKAKSQEKRLLRHRSPGDHDRSPQQEMCIYYIPIYLACRHEGGIEPGPQCSLIRAQLRRCLDPHDCQREHDNGRLCFECPAACLQPEWGRNLELKVRVGLCEPCQRNERWRFTGTGNEGACEGGWEAAREAWLRERRRRWGDHVGGGGGYRGDIGARARARERERQHEREREHGWRRGGRDRYRRWI